MQPTVQLKLSLDTKPERGLTAPERSGERDSGRGREVAFEMGADKLDVLVQELGHALALMEPRS